MIIHNIQPYSAHFFIIINMFTYNITGEVDKTQKEFSIISNIVTIETEFIDKLSLKCQSNHREENSRVGGRFKLGKMNESTIQSRVLNISQHWMALCLGCSILT